MKDLNLIPETYLQQRRTIQKRKNLLYGAIAGAIVAVVLIAAPLGVRIGLEAQKKQLDAKINETHQYVEKKKQFEQLESIYRQRSETGKILDPYGFALDVVIESCRKSAPQKLLITSLNLKEDAGVSFQGTLDGKAEAMNDIASFVAHLKETGNFSSIKITSVKKGTSAAVSLYEFSITVSGIRNENAALK